METVFKRFTSRIQMLSILENSFEDDYELKEKIGSGSFSNVWLCVQKASGKKRAAKILNKNYGKTIDWNSINEVEVANSVKKHPFLLPTEAAYYEPEFGKVILITELMGKTLLDVVKSKDVLTDYQIKTYMYQMLEGLKYLHENGFIHRDVKPENVMLTSRDRFLKIGDFGTACRVVADQSYAAYVATRWYRSPECLLTCGRYGTKMDVWAAGCVLFEIATCRPLFAGFDVHDQVAKIDALLGEPEPRLIDRFRKHKSDVLVDRYETGTAGKQRTAAQGAGLHTVYPQYRPAHDILKDMIVYDPIKRLSADRLLRKPYFYEMKSTEYENNLKEFRMSQYTTPYCIKINRKPTESGPIKNQSSTIKNIGPESDRVHEFQKCLRQNDTKDIVSKKQNTCLKYNTGKPLTVQKSFNVVNVNPEIVKQNPLSKLNAKNTFSKKSHVVSTSIQSLNKGLTTKTIANCLLNRPPFR